MQQQTYSPTMNIMMKAVRKAARGLMRDFGEVESLQVSKKGPGDFVSVADTKTEKALYEELVKAKPEYSFLMEESGLVTGNDGEYRWIIDPIDGTTNFLHGSADFCINIALEKKLPSGKSEVVAAITDNPAKRETFWAEKGKGAWLEADGRQASRLRVTSRSKLGESLICIGSIKSDHEFALKTYKDVSGIRCIGSSALALAYVAAGRFDGFIQYGAKPWDLAAGILLVKEAGGYISDYDNGSDMFDKKQIVAANEYLHFKLLKYLK